MSEIPRGLRLFAAGTPARVRRGKALLVAAVAAAAVGLTWPVYPLFAGARPFLLGLPLSFVWVILWLLVVFGALIVAYRAEYGGPGAREAGQKGLEAEPRQGPEAGSSGGSPGRLPAGGEAGEAADLPPGHGRGVGGATTGTTAPPAGDD